MYINSQTFYLDPDSINQAISAYVTSVDLYFNQKPTATGNLSGITNPRVTISISDTDNSGAPLYSSTYPFSAVTLPYASINADTTGATATTFTLPQPVLLQSGRTYSIDVQADDPGFTLWYAQSGQAILGNQQQAFGGFSGGHPGALFDYGNSGTLTPVINAQLKYTLRVAQFTANSVTYELVNNPYEFFIVNNQKGAFTGGELVFPLYSNVSSQTVATTTNSTKITGTGTAFQSQFNPNDYIVIGTSTGIGYQVAQILSISNNTVLQTQQPILFTNSATNFFKAPVGTLLYNNQAANTVFLSNSQAANTSYCFQPATLFTGTVTASCNQINALSSVNNLFVGQPIIANTTGIQPGTTVTAIVNSSCINISTQFTGTTGTAQLYCQTPIIGAVSGAQAYISSIYDFPVYQIQPEIGIQLPAGSNAAIQYNLAYYNSTSNAYTVTNANFTSIVNNTQAPVTNYNALILSRSKEVLTSATLYGSNNKSGVLQVTLNQSSNASGMYTSPYIYSEKLDVFSSINTINNSLVNENTDAGFALARHITTKIKFDSAYAAQDLMVQTIAYVPAGTSIAAYAKLYNSTDTDAFSLKQWTTLYPVSAQSNNTPISSTQSNNYITLTYGLPNAPVSQYVCNGTVQVSSVNAQVTGSGTTFGTDVVAGNIVKIYNPLVANAFYIAVVNNVVNSTVLYLNTSTANVSICQPGFYMSVVNNAQQGFINPQNQNIVRYYNSNNSYFDGYDTLQIKMVLLSNTTALSPRLASLTAVGLSV